MTDRLCKQLIRGSRAIDGAGVHLTRVLNLGTVEAFDPFLMLDVFDSTDPADYIKGFPWHPHRGIETITYLIEGEIDHGDNIGHSGKIVSGACQWMRAGAGIIHQEMPQPSPRMLGMQLWLNMPGAQKMIPPQYNDLTAAAIPEVAAAGCRVKVIAGEFGGQRGPMDHALIPITMLDVALEPHAAFSFAADPKATLFFYIFRGSVSFPDGGSAEQTDVVLTTAGDELSITAGKAGAQLVLLQAQPLHEPVFWGGPVVMDTQEGLDLAFAELRNGTFIKKS